MTQKDLNIIDDLLTRTNNLPDILHLRAAAIGYKLTENDKKLMLLLAKMSEEELQKTRGQYTDDLS